jgi:uncharacterized protein
MTTLEERREAAPARPAYRLVDCDVHPAFSVDFAVELMEWLSEPWRVKLGSAEIAAGEPIRPGSRPRLPFNPLYIKDGGFIREDLLLNGGVPASDAVLSARQLLDPYGIDRAILIPQGTLGIGMLPDGELAGEIASATNHWLKNKWLDVDPRWRATLVIGNQDPLRSAREIARWGNERGFAGVYVSLNRTMLGDQAYWPIYEAAEHYQLPVVLHPTGGEGIYLTSAQLAGGPPANFLDYRIAWTHAFQVNMANLIASGVLERFPRLKFVFAECGFAWVAETMWRMDVFWKATRSDTPWVRRPPSEYIRERIRFTTQPFIEPPLHGQIREVLEMTHAAETLMFSTDFPLWDSDAPTQIEREIPKEFRQRVLSGNASDVYGARLD